VKVFLQLCFSFAYNISVFLHCKSFSSTYLFFVGRCRWRRCNSKPQWKYIKIKDTLTELPLLTVSAECSLWRRSSAAFPPSFPPICSNTCIINIIDIIAAERSEGSQLFLTTFTVFTRARSPRDLCILSLYTQEVYDDNPITSESCVRCAVAS
jgi:hypothetical protein